jgi:hypothetical protein
MDLRDGGYIQKKWFGVGVYLCLEVTWTNKHNWGTLTIPFLYIKEEAVVGFKLGDPKHDSNQLFRRGIPREGGILLKLVLFLNGHNPFFVGDTCFFFVFLKHTCQWMMICSLKLQYLYHLTAPRAVFLQSSGPKDHDGSGIAGGHCANYDFELHIGMANNGAPWNMGDFARSWLACGQAKAMNLLVI